MINREKEKNVKEFKDSLKNAREHIEGVIQDYNQIIIDIKAEFPISKEEVCMLSKLGITSPDVSLRNRGEFFLKTGKFIGKKHVEAIKMVNDVSGYLHKINILKKLIKTIQKIINAYQPNKVSTFLDISTVLFFIQYAKKYDGLSDEALSTCLGMAIATDLEKYSKNQGTSEDFETILALGDFYNQDGSLKNNPNAGLYIALLNDLAYSANYNMPQDLWVVDRKLISGLASLLGKKDVTLHEKREDSNSDSKQNELVDNLDYSTADEIKKYYSNGEIVQIPEDLGQFVQLLKKSQLDEQEQKYICDLVKCKVIEKIDVNLEALDASDKAVYQQAKAILDTLDYRSTDYCNALGDFQNLALTCSLLRGTSGNVELVYLNTELSKIIAFLSSFIQSYSNSEAVMANNLVFIGNYFADDLDTIDSNMRPKYLSLLHRIIKENESRFRKILSNEKLLWQPFFIYDGTMSISFVEIDSGIYVVLGCNPVNGDFNQIVNRAIKESDLISQLSDVVKDENRRMGVLLDNAEYLYDLEFSSVSRN